MRGGAGRTSTLENDPAVRWIESEQQAQMGSSTSCYLAIPTHGFTVVLSVFMAHLLQKPLVCLSANKKPCSHFGKQGSENRYLRSPTRRGARVDIGVAHQRYGQIDAAPGRVSAGRQPRLPGPNLG